MTAGLQVWDASGNLIADVTDYFGKVLGTATLTADQNGSLVESGLALGTPFWFVFPLSSTPGPYPEIDVSGTTLSWTFDATQTNFNCRLVYGVR